MKLLNENATKSLGKVLASCLKNEIVIYLKGDLGAGKTTLARGLIQSFGFDKVKSPTYSIVESYQNENINIHHFDLYRLAEAEELEALGIRDYEQNAIVLAEWPEKGFGFLPKSDLIITLKQDKMHRTVFILAQTDNGIRIKKCLEDSF